MSVVWWNRAHDGEMLERRKKCWQKAGLMETSSVFPVWWVRSHGSSMWQEGQNFESIKKSIKWKIEKEEKNDPLLWVALNNCIHYSVSDKNLWVGDSGASHHVTNSLEGMYNLRTCDEDEKVIPIQVIDNRNYLYPDGHRMTHQMRWFKGSRDRGLRSDIAAWETIEINYFL